MRTLLPFRLLSVSFLFAYAFPLLMHFPEILLRACILLTPISISPPSLDDSGPYILSWDLPPPLHVQPPCLSVPVRYLVLSSAYISNILYSCLEWVAMIPRATPPVHITLFCCLVAVPPKRLSGSRLPTIIISFITHTPPLLRLPCYTFPSVRG